TDRGFFDYRQAAKGIATGIIRRTSRQRRGVCRQSVSTRCVHVCVPAVNERTAGKRTIHQVFIQVATYRWLKPLQGVGFI
ncbi:hypothetical protein, partial [Klebsiella pneumoniae]|uniref:hypothetical protein n=1 Tax=Klebsiella pneumoniae TaxID=573 RepID=UPI001331134C